MVRRAGTTRARKPSLRDRVATVLDTLRPSVQSDGGDVELLDVDKQGIVHLRLHGACIGCPSSTMTLTLGIERTLKDQIPEVAAVVCEEPT